MSVDALKSFQADEEAYRRMRGHLLKEYKGKWVAVHNGKVVAVGDGQSEVIKKPSASLATPLCVNKVGEEARVVCRVYRSR